VSIALGTIFLDGDHHGVRFERDVDATPEEVWGAVATPEGVAGWLARPVRWRLEPGERWEIAFDDGAAHGLIVAVEPGRRLELSWREADGGESLVRIEVLPATGGCRVVLEHAVLGAEGAIGFGAGWQAHLEALERAVAGAVAGDAADWWERYRELRPAYERAADALAAG
jgi:uncharacterized protein YndB with AHSA1/START domain